MYLPAHFRSPSESDLIEVVRASPFATLITPIGGRLEVSHLPLLLEIRGEDWVLVGHMARANPHLQALEAQESLAVFHGPHAYVSPCWYAEADVPTWNYVVAHLSGKARLLETERETLRALAALARFMEGADGWKFQIPEDLAAPGVLQKAIVAFEIPVRERLGKFKLSQNRSAADFAGVLEGLGGLSDDQSRAVKQWMEGLRGSLSK